jgi:cytochrome b6-f complex iron-sulfur subunit
MPLIDDLRIPLDDEERTRRAFFQAVGAGALAVAGLGTGITAIRFLWPEVLFEPDTRFRIGRPEDIPVGTLAVLPAQKIFVVRDASGFYALSAVCTHLGCLVQFEREQDRILCPCHGSRFARDGRVTQGPAPRPLPRLQLSIERGLLVVDVAREVGPDAVLKV